MALALAGGIAAFAALRRPDPRSMLRMPIVETAYLSLAVGFAAAGFVPNAMVLAATAVVAGAAAGGVYLFVTTWIQVKTGTELHGRLFAMVEGASSAVAPAGYLAAGALLELLGPEYRWVLFLAVAGVALLWATFLLFTQGKEVDRFAV